MSRANHASGEHRSGGLKGNPFDGLQVFATDFTALNNSGVDGSALLFLDRKAQTVTVHIQAEGLEPGQVHPQHIHGFIDDTDAKTPTIRQDTDGDGFVELLEGLETYGPVQLNLTLNPADSAHDHGTEGHDHTGAAMFPTADENGVLRYTETFRFNPNDPNAQAIFDSITPFGAKEIVLHGLTLQDDQGRDAMGVMDEADGTAGYKAVLPVASGELQNIGLKHGLLKAFHQDKFEEAKEEGRQDRGEHGSNNSKDFQVFATDFTALNNSGVDGNALLFLDRKAQTVTVHIQAEGLEPGQVHAQHIHGFIDDTDAKTPTIRQDTDGDGFVELLEGLETYGPVQLNLTLNPADSAHDHGTEGHDHTGAAMFPTADENGVLRYTETFRFSPEDPNAQAIFDSITPLGAKEIVLHGLTLQEGQGRDAMGVMDEADGTAGYKAVLPVASGELQELNAPGWLLNALRHDDMVRAEDWVFG